MNQEDAFIEAILQNPDDDNSRLVYADWLEDHGNPRGDAIRAKCHIASMSENKRPDLEYLIQKLWTQHREVWVEYCGLILQWDQALLLFERKLAEAVVWCGNQHPELLRTPALQPPTLIGSYTQQQWNRPTTEQRQRIVNALTNRRAQQLSAKGCLLEQRTWTLPTGKLVLFNPDHTLSDGAAETLSQRYFDEDNVPAWDTWVYYAEGETRLHPAYDTHLVAWVPAHLVDDVDEGIQVNPEECICWATDMDTPWTRKLRAAGLLV